MDSATASGTATGASHPEDQQQADKQDVPRTRFRFKRKRRRHDGDNERETRRTKPHHEHNDQDHDNSHEHTTNSSRHHHRHHHYHQRERSTSPSSHRRHKHRHRHRHSHRGRAHEEDAPDTTKSYGPHDPSLSPETAFRESLFDAMADDEGALFWEGVYGQPLHVYPDPSAAIDGDAGPEEDIQRMTDDEYAAYVRAQMWAKTHEGLLEERRQKAAAEQARRNAATEQAQRERERENLQRRVEESLRFGEQRRRAKAWKTAWAAYTAGWARPGWDGPEGMPWPTLSGKMRDVHDAEQVRGFFQHGRRLVESGDGAAVGITIPTSASASASGLGDIADTEVPAQALAQAQAQWKAALKRERVRWHPDKMLQRVARRPGATEDSSQREEIMRAVTAVFQVVDALWSTVREDSGR